MINSYLRLMIAAGLMTATASCLAAAPDTLTFSRSNTIFLLPAGAKTPVKITKGRSPSLNADRSKIAFSRETKPNGELYELVVWDIKAKSAKVLTKQNMINDVKWSPTSQTIAFTSFSGSTHHLNTIQSDGSGLKRIGASGQNGVDSFYSLRWAGDGQSIMFHDMNNVFRLDGSGSVIWKASVKSILNDNQISSSDSFAPCPNNPNLIAYTKFVKPTKLWQKYIDEPNTALFLYDLNSKTRTRITKENVFAVSPTWSRNGQTIYFCGYLDKNAREPYPFRVYSIGKGGSGLQELAKGEEPMP